MDPETTDEQLLAGFVGGDESAFEELMRRHEERIFALAIRMTGDRADALDAVQETFIAAFRRASSFRGQSAFGTWLYRIGINTCTDLLRKRKRSPEPREELVLADPTTAPMEDSVAQRDALARALEGIAPDYREAVLLYDLMGASYEEVAQLTEAPLGTVKSRISRGRRILAQKLEHPTAPQPSKEVT